MPKWYSGEIREKDHNKAFYKLCQYMQSDYHQVEFDMRLFLVLLDQGETLYDSN